MASNFLAKLEAEYREAPVLVAGPASGAIPRIEAFAEFVLPADYRLFVSRFGAGIVGAYPVFGHGAAEAMGADDASVVDVTTRFRRDGWPGVDRSLVISMDLAGNPITLDRNGLVCRYDHDAAELDEPDPSFEAWVLRHLSV